MRLSKKFRPELVVGNGNRYSPDYCYLDTSDPEAPVLVSTDGYMLAAVPVEIEDGDTAGLIPASAIEAARQIAGDSGIRIRASGQIELPDSLSIFDRPEAKFPEWRKAIPNQPGSVTIVIDAVALKAVARAIGATKAQPRVTLNFEPKSDGMVVISVSRQRASGAKALLAAANREE